MDEKKLNPKALMALVRHKAALDSLGEQPTVWKAALADAVLDVFRERASVTAEELRAFLEERMHGVPPVAIAGTNLSLEAAQLALRTAMAHLTLAVADREQQVK